MTLLKSKGNFKTVWLQDVEGSRSPHQLFLKEHWVRKQDEEYPRGRTLLALNIPFFATKDSVKHIFSQDKKSIETVTFTNDFNECTGFKSVFVVFKNDSDLKNLLSLPPKHTLTLLPKDTESIGLKKWCKEFNAHAQEDENKMNERIESFMKAYDKKVLQEQMQEKKEGEDEEGWTKVSSTKKRGKHGTVRKESILKKLQEETAKKNKKKQLLHFYTFQIRESKKQHLVELRQKFELDKQKLQQFKQKRRFKPY